MMKKAFIFLLTVLSQVAYAQADQAAINDQVWKPFINSFASGNNDEFLAVHSKDVVRSPRDSKQIYGWEEYARQMDEGKKKRTDPGRKRSIDLRFTERFSQDNLAFDVGIYRTTSIGSNGVKREFYGRFHVVLRKENGVWKILLDTDSSEGGTIGEKEFLAAHPME